MAIDNAKAKPDAQAGEALQALERFVVDNDDLLALELRIGRFNIFDALRITHREIHHSNFLAFILNPAESHGQGQLFLKALLMDLLKQAPPEKRPLSPIDLDGADLRGIEVKREWKNIDLLITCQQPQFAILIENKVGPQEHSDQLRQNIRSSSDACQSCNTGGHSTYRIAGLREDSSLARATQGSHATRSAGAAVHLPARGPCPAVNMNDLAVCGAPIRGAGRFASSLNRRGIPGGGESTP